jgi:aspartate aminotransferase-like enzyme
VEGLARLGFTVGGGYGKWKPDTFRIGHMGEVRSEDLESLLGALDAVLEGDER